MANSDIRRCCQKNIKANISFMNNITAQWPNSISSEKRNAILQIIYANMEDTDDREKWLDNLESISDEEDANEVIESLSNNNDL